MAFDDGVQKETQSEGRKALAAMTLLEIERELGRLIGNISFNAQNSSERTKKNCKYLLAWAEMGFEEFGRRASAAWSNKIPIEIASGAMKDANTVVWPEDDAGGYLEPKLIDIIALQRARLDRINFAKEKEAEEHQKAVDEGWVSPDGA